MVLHTYMRSQDQQPKSTNCNLRAHGKCIAVASPLTPVLQLMILASIGDKDNRGI